MSKTSVAMFFLCLFVTSNLLAQTREPSKKGAGRVATVEEPDFTRFRVVTEEGVLAVFDADEDWDGRDEPYSQLAYWHDFDSEQFFFFDQLLFTPNDVLQSIATMQRDLGIDPIPILLEKPEFSPFPEITSVGEWRLATELDVVTVMAGGVPGQSQEGQTAAGPCGACEFAAVSGPVTPPIRGTPRSQLFSMAATASSCCGGGGGGTPDPLRFIHPIADHLGVMENDLLVNYFDPSISPFNEFTGEVAATLTGATNTASAPFRLYRGDEELRTGSASISFTDNGDSVNVQIATTYDDGVVGPDPQWTLDQTVQLTGDVLTFNGSIGVVEATGNSYSLPGGWTYSSTNGPLIDPSSDSDFQIALGTMLGFDPPAVAGGIGASLGPYVALPSNIIAMALNYARDRRITYTAPTSCSGPTYQAVGGQSCANVDILCDDILGQLALKIHNLTNVSDGFKKCMKGRLGCGGSKHPKLNIRCDDYGSCGPCFYRLDSLSCNIGGRDVWYCLTLDQIPSWYSPIECACVVAIFHEASHACGAQDLRNGAPLDAYRIGSWFEQRCFELP